MDQDVWLAVFLERVLSDMIVEWNLVIQEILLMYQDSLARLRFS